MKLELFNSSFIFDGRGNYLKSLHILQKIKHIRNIKIILDITEVKITPQNKGKSGKFQGSKEHN